MTEQATQGDLQAEYQNAVMELLGEVCQRMELDLHPEVRDLRPPYLEVELVGEDAAAAFGRFGKRLDALQYLVNLITSRKVGGDLRTVLDADGYRARREEALTQLAREYAAQVKERQEECELDPLPAQERRIIHRALLDDPDVRTYSEGEDPDRRIVIAPK